MLPVNRLITLFAVLLLMTGNANAYSTNNLSVKLFHLALNACEQGITGKLPHSRSALRILRNQLQKYERYRDRVAERAPDILQSLELTYEGNEGGLGILSFQEAYQICEQQLPDRLTEAENNIEQITQARSQRREARRQALAARQQKIDAAMVHIEQALNVLCVPILSTESPPDPAVLLKYKAAHKQAIEAFADIGQQFYNISMVNAFTGETEKQRRQIKTWFKICDESLSNSTADAAGNEAMSDEDTGMIGPFPPEEEGPVIPTGRQSSVMNETPQPIADSPDSINAVPSTETGDMDSLDKEIAREFNNALQRMKGDRHNVLSSEGRLPDYTNSNDDDTLNASIWQYEKFDDTTSSCRVYTFQQDRLQSEEQLDDDCPPF